MRIPGVKSFRRFSTWIQSRLFKGTLILGYHRVDEFERDPYSICVSPENFSQQLEAVKKFSQPITLQDLVNGLKQGHLPERAVVLTFDDGYADTLYHVKPMLQSFQIPATVFVTTGFLGRAFWWDALERIIFEPPVLPDKLQLAIEGRTYEREIGGNMSDREVLQKDLYQFLLPLISDNRQKVMDQLSTWAEWDVDKSASNRALNSAEVIELSKGDLIDIGSHTMTHPHLANLPVQDQHCEIQESRTLLEELTGKKVNSFSYPNGSSSRETRVIVKKSGYSSACTSYEDVVMRNSDPFNLPRFWIPNWDGVTFKKWLRFWLPL